MKYSTSDCVLTLSHSIGIMSQLLCCSTVNSHAYISQLTALKLSIMLFSVTFLFILTKTAFSQTSCLDAGNQGPNLGGGCPPGLTATDDGNCCESGFVTGVPLVTAQTASSTAAAATMVVTVSGGGTTIVPVTAGSIGSTTCQDKVNPFSGTSDCPMRASLCNNPLYYTVMTQQCPKTCGRCSSTSSTGSINSTSCQDLVNPRTGTSDCPSLSALCTDYNYQYIMGTQCPKTCGFCSASISSNVLGSSCVDLINPMTGSSDCPARKSLCQDSTYRLIMQKQCPVTCGFCSG